MIIMAEVLLKCLVRETKSVYRKLYEVFRLPLVFIAIVSTAIFITGVFVYCLIKVKEFVNLYRDQILMWCQDNFYNPIKFAVVFTVGLISSIPLWAIGVIIALVIFVGLPVGYAFIKCVVREDKKKGVKA